MTVPQLISNLLQSFWENFNYVYKSCLFYRELMLAGIINLKFSVWIVYHFLPFLSTVILTSLFLREKHWKARGLSSSISSLVYLRKSQVGDTAGSHNRFLTFRSHHVFLFTQMTEKWLSCGYYTTGTSQLIEFKRWALIMPKHHIHFSNSGLASRIGMAGHQLKPTAWYTDNFWRATWPNYSHQELADWFRGPNFQGNLPFSG